MLAQSKPFIHVECFFVTCPDDFQLLEESEGAHVAGFFSPQDGDKLVEGLKRRRGFELHSAPTLTVRQGQTGMIESGQEFIYPTEYLPPKVRENPAPGSFPVTPSTPINFETTTLGITAEFKGRRNSRGEIDFEIALEHRAFEGFLNYGSPITTKASDALGRKVDVNIFENKILMPVFHQKRIATKATLLDGHYLAVGGLRKMPRADLKDRVKSFSADKNGEDANLLVLIKVTGMAQVKD